MLAPKKQKYRKQFRGIWKRVSTTGHEVSFGQIGLKAIDPGFIRDRQIESARLVLARATRKEGKFWIRIFPDKPYTKKPAEVTMGAGKGDVAFFVASISPGRVLFEIDGLDMYSAKIALKNIQAKLPIRTKIIIKGEI